MINQTVDRFLERVPFLEKGSTRAAALLHHAVLARGEPAREVADKLHGTWLGHPLHPVLTDVVVGAWMFGSFSDLVSAVDRSPQTARTADALVALGTLAAVPTALSGLTDYSTVPNPAASAGLSHGLLNSLALTLYMMSLRARQKGQRGKGILLSTVGLAVATAAAYLGGHLVYAKKVGTNHAEPAAEPVKWTPVLNERDLLEHNPARVEIEGNPVLLYRHGQLVHAVGAVCPHAGAPLEEGEVEGTHLQCPWHDSVFNLRNGEVVHGPATFALPDYQARIMDGRVEVRLAKRT